MLRFTLLASTMLPGACATVQPAPLIAPPSDTQVTAAEPATVAMAPAPARNAELATFFDRVDAEELALSPLG
jgi:hypothetical protein